MVNLNIDGNLSAKNIDKIEEKIDKNGYGEIAGGKNLANPDNFIYNKVISWKTGEIVDNNEYLISGYIKIKPNTVYTKTGFRGSGECFYYDKNKNPIDHISGIENQEHIFRTPENAEFVILSALKTSENLQLEEGETATSYEPYFPSNKMLAEENTQQSTEMMDIKMLGWSVPRECPIQNEVNGNQFIQKVGRVDLGTISYKRTTYPTELGDDIYIFETKDIPVVHKTWSRKANILCAKYTTRAASFTDDSLKYFDKTISTIGNGILIIRDDDYNLVEFFKESISGVYLYYELETPITTTIDGNEIGETVSDVRKETTVNLLKPTLETITDVNNITYKNNGDGTYTISGTSTTQIVKHIADNIVISQKCVLTGCKGGSINTYSLGVFDGEKYYEVMDGRNTEIPANTYQYAYIVVRNGVTIPDNTIIKPMITTNLDATYDDFVPYTGDSGSLNGDVSDLRGDVDEMLTSVSDVRKETTVNLLNPTLQSTTRNGVTCTNNGGGTYTFKGTATENTEFQIDKLTLEPGQYKYFGSSAYVRKTDNSWVKTIVSGDIVSITEDNPVLDCIIYVNKGDSVDSVFSFMVTTNLNATIDDFVPYTGSTGALNTDVASLLARIKALEAKMN